MAADLLVGLQRVDDRIREERLQLLLVAVPSVAQEESSTEFAQRDHGHPNPLCAIQYPDDASVSSLESAIS
jgi:hypothetical protein